MHCDMNQKCLSVLLVAAVLCQCPDELADLPNAAFSASAGCLWADSDETHRFDNYEEAAGRCRCVVGDVDPQLTSHC